MRAHLKPESLQALADLTRSHSGQALLEYLAQARVGYLEACVMKDGQELYQAQGAVKTLDALRADLEGMDRKLPRDPRQRPW